MLLKDNCYVEDNNLYIKGKLKYDLYNLIESLDSEWIKELEKELEVMDN